MMHPFRQPMWKIGIYLVLLLAALSPPASGKARRDLSAGEPSYQRSPAAAPPRKHPEQQLQTTAPAADEDLTSLSIEELMELEVQTVVSASRYRQKLSEAPSSITIITAEQIRTYGYRTLGDILGSVRGFATTYDRNYQYLGIRGFGRLGDYNTRILLLVDGHRVNDAVYDSAPIGAEFPLDIDLIERVEVTRGPGSSLYGSNAFFGVINIITRGGKDVGGELSVEAGSAAAYRGRLSYGMSAPGGGAVLASAGGYAGDGEDLYFREFDPRYPFADMRARNNGVAERADFSRLRQGYAKLEQKGFLVSAAYSERTKGIPTASFGADFNDPGNRSVDERGYLDLQYTRRSGRGDECAVRAYYDHYRFDGDNIYGGTLNRDRASGSWYGGEVRLSTRRLEIHHLVVGTEYEIRGRQEQWNGDMGPSAVVYLDDHRSSRSGAAYIQDEITVSPTFLLYAGIRRDQVSTFGGSTNPRLAAVLTPLENGTIKLLYGRAFRAPSVYELYYQSPPSILSNPELRPETIDTYELAYEHDLGSGLRATVGRYSYIIRDLITQTYDASTGTSSFQNLEKAEATGTELEISKAWVNGADGRFSYSYQNAKDPNTGETLTNAPKVLAKINLSVPFFDGRIRAALEEQYTGSRFTLAGRKTPAYAVTNLTLLGRNKDRTREVSFSIYNALNKSFEDPVSMDLFPLDAVRQDGRTVRLKVTYAF